MLYIGASANSSEPDGTTQAINGPRRQRNSHQWI